MDRMKHAGVRGRRMARAVRSGLDYLAEALEGRVLLSGVEMLGSTPALFVENQGQWADSATRFALLGSSVTVRFTEQGLDFRLAGQAREPGLRPDEPEAGAAGASVSFSMRFDGARLTQPLGYEPMGVTNFMLGDPSTWRSDVPSFAGLVYPGLYPGIDLHIRGLKGSLKYEFHVSPGVDYHQIQVRYEGIEGLSLAADGSLHVMTAIGSIVDAAPVVYQEGAGGRVALPGRYELLGEMVHGFVVDGVDATLPLVIDPELAWGTYLGGGHGGGNYDIGRAVTVDSSGNVLVTGETTSSGWISGGWDTSYNGNGYSDAFVVKLSPEGQHLWSTYLGGGRNDSGYGIAADGSGNVLVTGDTNSSDWVSGGWDTSHNGGWDAFVVKLSPEGQHLWSTYLGGVIEDSGSGIAVDGAGNVLVTGTTNSSGWVSGGWDTSHDGMSDAFVVKFSPQGQHLWSTYLGGGSSDRGSDIATDGSGNVLVTGRTDSSGWVFGGWNTGYSGGWDAFVVKLSPQGQHLWSTYLGGGNSESGDGIAIDGSGNVLVNGSTTSSGWISGGWDTSHNGSSDGFVVKLSPQGQHLWSTYLGGGSNDFSRGIAVDGAGNVLVTGEAESAGWVPSGGDGNYINRGGAFVVKLSPQGQHLWSTYVGDRSSDFGRGIAVDGSGNVLVTGSTIGAGWVSGGWDTSHNGGWDAFVVKLSPESQHLWSTYLGGGGADSGFGIALDGFGNVLVMGTTESSSWVSGGWDTSHNGGWDAFVVKLSAQGRHLWSTYLGGTSDDRGRSIAVDSSGNVLVTGATYSSGWVSGGWDTSHNGGNDAFVVKLNPQGQHLWSTYLGGGGWDAGLSIAVDGSGNVLVTGETDSSGWVSGGWDTSHNGGWDAFVVKLSPQGQHLWSTYLGGAGKDHGYGIAVDGAGSVLVAGRTDSSGWVSGGWNTSYSGGWDAFVVKLSPQGQHLWSTYLGGTGKDYGNGIAVDGLNNVLVTGETESSSWVSGGWDTSYNGISDAFVVKLCPQGQHLWSTYLGGTIDERGNDITVDGSGNVLLTGETWSAGWVSGGWDTSYKGWYDAFVVKLSPQGQHLWSIYLGGTGKDSGYGIAIDDSGHVLVTGTTESSGWLSGGWDTSYNGGGDAFVIKITDLATPLPRLTGTSGDDAHYLRLNPDNPQQIQVFLGNAAVGSPVSVMDTQAGLALGLRGLGGQDSLTIDLTHGNPFASLGLTIESGSFTLNLVGGSMLDLPSLVLAPSATLDLGEQGLALRSGDWASILGLVAAGRAGGTGLVSSHAARPENVGKGLVVVRNEGGDGVPLLAEINGQALGVDAILIRYTWHGDSDLNGVIDGDDYFRLDAAFLMGTSGRFGDPSGDGRIDAVDYQLIDLAYLAQAGAMGAALFAEGPIVAEGAFLDELATVRPAALPDALFGREAIEVERLAELFDPPGGVLV